MCPAPIKLVADPFLDEVIASPEFRDVTEEFWRLQSDVSGPELLLGEIDDNLAWRGSCKLSTDNE